MEKNELNNKSFSVGCIEITKKYGKKLGFDTIFNRFKKKGDKLSNLVTGLTCHKLHFSGSVNNASEWLNLPHIQAEFHLSENVPKTFYRVLETVGRHDKSILTLLQNRLNELYLFENTDTNIDWSSIVLYGNRASLGEYGYSRDHRPDKKQITFGISQFRAPINIPFALSIESGNVLDKVHFETTFKRTLKALNPDSLIVVDRGANSKDIKQLIRSKQLHYLCAASLSAKVDALIEKFDKSKAVVVDDKDTLKTYCLKYAEGFEFAYLFFSEKLYHNTVARKKGNAEKIIKDGAKLEKKLTSSRKQKSKKFDLQAFVAEIRTTLQHRLKPMTQVELCQKVFERSIDGREGFFLLKSSRNLTEEEALTYYRSRDSIEKLMDSLKNTIRIKPVRVWTDNAIKGALVIGYLAQLMLALMQYEHQNLQKIRPKTLLDSLRNLTLTIDYHADFTSKRIISNYDAINQLVFNIKTRIT